MSDRIPPSSTGDAGAPRLSSRVFISYRREETAYPAGWLYDRLDERLGDAQVFKDVDSIPLGDDYVAAISTAVGSCDVLLALIGDRWLTVTDASGQRRLDDPHDFVRLEIEAALARNVRIIPVLVDGAQMPRGDELPDSLAGLVRRQALGLSPSSFDSDTNRLARILASTLAEVREAQPRDPESVEPEGTTDLSATPPEETAQPVERDGRTTHRTVAGANLSDSAAPAGLEPTDPSPRHRWRRTAAMAAATLVVVAVIVGLVALVSGDDDDASDPSAPSGGIEVDRRTVTSPDGLELTGLDATVRNDPPVVGDTLTVTYSLTNVTDAPVRFAYTFVGARDPTDDNRDPEDVNEGVVLAPGESLDAQGRVLLDAAGTWLVWPCYELAGGQVCPDEWQVISFLVG